MANAADLVDQVRAHLVALGLVRLPDVPGDEPPVWLHPEGGAIAPGDKSGAQDDANLVLSVIRPTGMASRPMEAWLRRDIVEVWLRARMAPLAMEFEPALREVFVGDPGPRREWDMGALRVHSSQEWTALQAVPGIAGPGHTFRVSYVIDYPA